MILLLSSIMMNYNSVKSEDNTIKPIWVEKWNTSNFDVVSEMKMYDSNLYITGVTFNNKSADNLLIMKYDLDGDLIWNKTWGGSRDDCGNSIEIYNDTIYVAGQTFNTKYNVLLINKYSLNGALIWSTLWNNSINDGASSISVDSTGIYVAGYSSPNAVLLKFDFDGKVVWYRNCQGWLITSITLDNSGIYCAGITKNATGDDNDLLIQKYDKDGNSLWSNTWEGINYESAESITIDNDSNVYVCGNIENRTIGCGYTSQIMILKYDNKGNRIWNRTWNVSENDISTEIAIYNSELYISGCTNLIYGYAALILKYNLDGNLLWNKTWTENKYLNYYTQSIIYDKDIYMAGGYNNGPVPNGFRHIFILKTNSDGSGLSAKTPSTLLNLKATSGNKQITITWQTPTSDGGSPITAYKVYRNGTLLCKLGNVTTYTDKGLVNDITYQYKVSAVNAVGRGIYSKEISATPTDGSGGGGIPGFEIAIFFVSIIVATVIYVAYTKHKQR